MRAPLSSARRRAIRRVAAASLIAGANAAACSSSSENGNIAEGGALDAAIADEIDAGGGSDGGAESGANVESGGDAEGGDGSTDVAVYPDAFGYQTPDACFLIGASCVDDSTCCSALCVDGGCTRLPVQQ